MGKEVKVEIEVSLTEIGVISALLDTHKEGDPLQKRWDDLYQNTHKVVFSTYGVRSITIPKRELA